MASVAWAGLVLNVHAQDVPFARPSDASSATGAQEDEAKRADPLARYFDPINPAKLQKGLDKLLGLDFGDESDKPPAPEIPEPVFFDLVRPLGSLKYGTELNYLLNPSTRNAPTLQVIEYEYVFADWRSVELDLSYFNGNLQILTPFYQRTLGVGPRRNWIHGYQLSLDLYLRSGFVGGSPTYIFSWKPREESNFSTTFFVGANRALIGGFEAPRSLSAFAPPAMGGNTDSTYGAWRPTFNADFFYKFNERWTIGIENDLFFASGKAGEYLSFPFVTYEAGEHAFFQLGGGYYHFENRDQFTTMAHINFLQPSRRKSRERDRESDSEEPRKESRLPGWLNRLLGDR